MTVNIPDFIPVLSYGNHADPSQGACVMEMVSYLAGEKFSDKPECVTPYLRKRAIAVNDFVSDDNRSKIALMVHRFVNTSGAFKGTLQEVTEKYGKLEKNIRRRLNIDPDFQFMKDFFKRDINNNTELFIGDLGVVFRGEKDQTKRLTNEEYDNRAIKFLEICLDEFDKIAERGEYALTMEDAFAQFAQHPSQATAVSQKVNA